MARVDTKGLSDLTAEVGLSLLTTHNCQITFGDKRPLERVYVFRGCLQAKIDKKQTKQDKFRSSPKDLSFLSN
jgi:hypothetical protein